MTPLDGQEREALAKGCREWEDRHTEAIPATREFSEFLATWMWRAALAVREERQGTTYDHEYRLSWECPSAACVMAHQDVAWENLTTEEWDALPWESSYRIADGGDIFSQRHTLEAWAEDHYQPVRNVRFERRIRPTPEDGWYQVAVRGATGVTHWKAANNG